MRIFMSSASRLGSRHAESIGADWRRLIVHSVDCASEIIFGALAAFGPAQGEVAGFSSVGGCTKRRLFAIAMNSGRVAA